MSNDTEYVALHRMGLPILDEKGNVTGTRHVEAGETVTSAELEAAGQTAEDIGRLTTEDETAGIALVTPGQYETAQAALAAAAARETKLKQLADLGFSQDAIDAAMAAQKGGAS